MSKTRIELLPERFVVKTCHRQGIWKKSRNFQVWQVITEDLHWNLQTSPDLSVSYKKDVPFEWTKTCHDPFSLLQKCINESPFLKYPDAQEPKTSFTDAIKYA